MAAPGLRAPSQDGAVVAEPPLTEAGTLLQHNRELLSSQHGVILGRSWGDLRREARRAAIAAAQRYFHEAGEPVPSQVDELSLVMAGHQPELFHPGVWVKNFALNRLARAHGAIPLNVIVDNDTAKANVLRVPCADGPKVVLVPFDHGHGEIPYEERPVFDEALFRSFGERAGEVMAGWPFRPMLPDFWAEVSRTAPHTRLLGERFVAGRRTFERHWGCHNLEVPLSRLCSTESFAWFVCHWLHDWPRFHTVYNGAVQAYRRRNGIRSTHHPVPDLITEDDWWEMPLWAWRADRPRRSRLMIRWTESELSLRADTDTGPAIHWSPNSPEDTVAAWRGLEQQGWKIRSRALTTTLFARLFLADLFVHGIGGGKYDEVTDEIIRGYYDLEPPGLMVLSATLWLPVPGDAVEPQDLQRAAYQQRDIHWNPQRHLPPSLAMRTDIQTLVRQKADCVRQQPTDDAGKRQRFRTLQRLTHQLQRFVADQEQAAFQRLEQLREQLRANKIRRDRSYAFCLFPEEQLRRFCLRFL